MSKAYTGGCGCGAFRYEVSAEPMSTNDCQCRQCQRDSGTGHGSYLAFPRAAARLTGEMKSFDFVGDGGTVKSRAFCPTCGTPVLVLFPQMPEIIVLRAGTLDEPQRYRAQAVYWTVAGHAWDRLDPEVRRFDKMPG